MDEQEIRNVLSDIEMGEIRAYATIGSTNDEAAAWIDQGATDFSLVIADEQTKGRGRFDRHWITKPGSSLAFSLIFIPSASEVSNLPLFAPLCGLAVRGALSDLFNLNAEIKWPNDILIQRKKCCGILVESSWSGSEIKGIVLGIGINISHSSLPPVDSQLFNAVCLEDVLLSQINRYQVLAAVIRSLHHWRPLLGTDLFFSEWQKHLAFRGEIVKIVQSEKQSIIGMEKGIDQQGRLVLILDSNEEKAFEVGDVHLRPTEQ